MQLRFEEVSSKVDIDLQKRIKNKHDTRVAAALESIGLKGITYTQVLLLICSVHYAILA
jgi:hypothetical protein